MSAVAFLRCEGTVLDERPEWCDDCGTAPLPPDRCHKGLCRAGRKAAKPCLNTTSEEPIADYARARHWWRREGWRRRQGRDLCPDCAASRTAAQRDPWYHQHSPLSTPPRAAQL